MKAPGMVVLEVKIKAYKMRVQRGVTCCNWNVFAFVLQLRLHCLFSFIVNLNFYNHSIKIHKHQEPTSHHFQSQFKILPVLVVIVNILLFFSLKKKTIVKKFVV